MTSAIARRSLAALLLAAPARAQDSPEVRARAFLDAYLARLQSEGLPRAFPWSDWLTTEFHALWTRAAARARQRQESFLDADPVLDAQDYDRPGDVRIERVSGPPERPSVRVSLRAFRRDSRRTTLSLVLEEERGAWRIRDILTHRPDGPPDSLRRRVARLAAQG
jgi:hypothetical protein